MDKIDEYIKNYWINAVNLALKNIKKLNDLSPDEIEILAESLGTSAKKEGIVFGYK